MTGRQKALENVPVRKNRGWKTLSCLLAAAVTAAGLPAFSAAAADFGWEEEDGKRYWYENGIRQGTEGRGKEIYDPDSDAWYWLDAVHGGALTTSKDVYQESLAGEWGDTKTATGERTGKWVRYDENGRMVKGWNTNDNGTYYFNLTYGTMAKGTVTIDGVQYTFDRDSGILKDSSAPVTDGWVTVGEASYWYEGGIKQGTEGRGKEIYDPGSDAWYWLDAIQGGALTRNKDVYQESLAGEWGDTENAGGERTGKWVRYDENGHMVKGWSTNDSGTYYFDLTYGTMAKGTVQIEGKWYAFDAVTGMLTGETTEPAPTPVPTPERGPLGTVEEGENVKYSGTWYGLDWKVTDRGKLIVTGNLTEKVGVSEWDEESNEWIEYASWLEAPWTAYDGETRTAYMDFTGATSLDTLFYLEENSYLSNKSKSCIEEIDLHNLDTSRVTHMNSMFKDCGRLTSLDLGSFDTSRVTDMHDMFSGCSSLTSLDVSSFDTSQVMDMYGMFYNCSSLTSLDVSSFDTGNVTDMYAMFRDCSGLTSLDLSSFDTGSVTDMGIMFSGCNSLTSLDLSSFDTSRAVDMSGMFQNCNSLTSLDLSNFDTSQVTDMNRMFWLCESLTSLDVSGFDTSRAADMSYMFANCSSLTSLDVSGFDTGRTRAMGYIFANCSSLTSLDVSSFDTGNVTDMCLMFYNCMSLTGLDVSNFDTRQVTDMSRMFSRCSNLTSLDLSNFDTSQVTDMSGMFRDSDKLANIYVGSGWREAAGKTDMFRNCGTSQVTVKSHVTSKE